MPFDSTADLFVMDNGCDCLLMVAEDGTATVAATSVEIAAADTGGTGVGGNESGVAVAAGGTVYFINQSTDSLLSYALDGTLATVVSGPDFDTQAGSNVNPEKIAFGPDGTLYVQDDSSDERVLEVDVDSGTVTVLVEESDFTSLSGISSVDMNGGIAVDASGTIYVASDDTPDAVFSITPAGVVSVLATAPDEVQSIETDATGGTFTITFDGETTDPVAFDAAAADVQTALEGLANIDPGDVEVTGTGSGTDPWLLTFMGDHAGSDVSEVTTDDSGLSGGSTTVDTEIDGGEFNDFDVYGTLASDGAFVVADDGDQNIYRITAAGEISVVLLEREIEAVNGGSVDLEGGIAYDEDGRLYIAEENESHLLRFDGKDGEVWVENSTLDTASGETTELDGGIAFRMPIVDVSPAIDAPSSGVPGETLSYEVVVSNTGPNTLDGFELSTANGLESPVVTVDDGTFDGTLWTGDLASGDTLTFTVDGTIPSGDTGTLDLTATTTAALGAIDTDTTNDEDSAAVDLTPSADLAIDKSAPASVAVGDSADLTLTVTNDGPSDAADVEVTDDLPVGLVLDSTAGDGWSCTDGAGSVTCTRADLAAGASSTLTLTVSTDVECTADDDDQPVCSTDGSEVTAFENTAAVSSATDDPDEGNNSDSTTTTLDTSGVEVEAAAAADDDEDILPAAGASTSQWALYALLSILLGAVLLARTTPARRRSIA